MLQQPQICAKAHFLYCSLRYGSECINRAIYPGAGSLRNDSFKVYISIIVYRPQATVFRYKPFCGWMVSFRYFLLYLYQTGCLLKILTGHNSLVQAVGFSWDIRMMVYMPACSPAYRLVCQPLLCLPVCQHSCLLAIHDYFLFLLTACMIHDLKLAYLHSCL